MNKKLYEFPSGLKKLFSAYLITIAIGVLVGLSFLFITTNYSSKGMIERFKGSDEQEINDMDIQINYEKSVSEMMMTTHNHILGLSFIFFSVGVIFYFNSITPHFWKMFLLIEPFISIIVSFASIWAVRFIASEFVYITFASATLMYLSLFSLIFISLFELLVKKSKR